jgi:hypothetical protein
MTWRDVLLAGLLAWFCCSWIAVGLLWAVLRVSARGGSLPDEVTPIGEKIVIVSRFEK